MKDSGVSVRCLRKGEDRLWRNCSFGATTYGEMDGTAFTNDPSFRPEAHLVAERNGRIVGKMESIIVEPHEAVLVDPIVVPNECVEEVARALLLEGLRIARKFNVREIQVLLQDRLPYLSTLLQKMEGWDFHPLWQKNLYSVKAESLCPPSDFPQIMELEWVPFKGPENQTFLRTLQLILQHAPLSRSDQGTDAFTLLEYCIYRCRADGNFYPEDWEMGMLVHPETATMDVQKREPIGIVMPAFLNAGRHFGGNLYIGVVPAARGRGLGKILQYRGLQTMVKRGAIKFLGSTDSLNLPMIKIFESLNYQLEGIEQYFQPV